MAQHCCVFHTRGKLMQQHGNIDRRVHDHFYQLTFNVLSFSPFSTFTRQVPHTRNNSDVWQVHSDDDGVTWSAPVPLPNTTREGWSWIGVGPPGELDFNHLLPLLVSLTLLLSFAYQRGCVTILLLHLPN